MQEEDQFKTMTIEQQCKKNIDECLDEIDNDYSEIYTANISNQDQSFKNNELPFICSKDDFQIFKRCVKKKFSNTQQIKENTNLLQFSHKNTLDSAISAGVGTPRN